MKKNLEGKNRDFGIFFEISNFAFLRRRDHVTINKLQSTYQTKADDLLDISEIVKSSKKYIFNHFRTIFFKDVQKLRSQKMTKCSITFQNGGCPENSFA